MSQLTRIHGGPDAWGVPLHDFSTNSNACGPCPQALAAVQAADATRYPDAAYTADHKRPALLESRDYQIEFQRAAVIGTRPPRWPEAVGGGLHAAVEVSAGPRNQVLF